MKKLVTIITVLILFLLAMPNLQAANMNNSDLLYFIPAFYESANNGNIIVVVGTRGSIRVSNDAAKWKTIASQVQDDLHSIIWAQDRFISVGNNGTVISSMDGLSWVKQHTGVNETLLSISRGTGGYVAVGKHGTILFSKDTQKWRTISVGVLDTINKIVWDGKRYVAVCGNGLILTSYDGQSWGKNNTGVKDEFKDIYTDGKSYTIAGTYVVYTTNNLKKLSRMSNYYSSGELGNSSLAIEKNQYYILSKTGFIKRSRDKKSWTDVNIKRIVKNNHKLESMTGFNSIKKFKNTYVIVGDNSMILTSKDLNVWKSISFELEPYFSKPLWNGKVMMVAGRENIYKSMNLKDWSVVEIENDTLINDLIWDGGKYLCITTSGNMYKSIDGDKWDKINLKQKVYLSDLYYDGSNYFCVGDEGTLLISKDGVAWGKIAMNPKMSIKGITSNGDTYVAMTNPHGLIASRDGLEWYSVRNIDNPSVSRLQYEGNKFFVTDWNKLIYSSDGLTWDTTLIDSLGIITSISSNADVTVCIDFNGKIAITKDYMNWEVVYSEKGLCLNDIVWDGNKFVCTGNRGVVLISENGTEWNKADLGILETDSITNIVVREEDHILVGPQLLVKANLNAGQWAKETISENEEFTLAGMKFIRSSKEDSKRKYINDKGLLVSYEQIHTINGEQVNPTTIQKMDVGMFDGKQYLIYKVNASRSYGSDGYDLFYNGKNNPYLYSSKNGVDWIEKEVTLPQKDYVYIPENIVYYKGKYIMTITSYHKEASMYIPYAEVLYSVDGLKWMDAIIEGTLEAKQKSSFGVVTYTGDGKKMESKSGLAAFYSVSTNGKTLVAAGHKGIIGHSMDGVGWKHQYLDNFVSFKKIIWDGKKFIAVGTSHAGPISVGTIAVSVDGVRWNTVTTMNNVKMNDIVFDGNQYLVIGNEEVVIGNGSTDTKDSIVMFSKNLSNWSFERVRSNILERGFATDGTISFIGDENLTSTK